MTGFRAQEPAGFENFVEDVEQRLRRALVARFGWQLGQDATADALAYGWEHWARVGLMENPAGYLYRVGCSRALEGTRRDEVTEPEGRDSWSDPWCEPSLEPRLAAMPERQRSAVVLIHGYGWRSSEVAEMLGLKRSTVETHLERGMSSLRAHFRVAAADVA